MRSSEILLSLGRVRCSFFLMKLFLVSGVLGLFCPISGFALDISLQLQIATDQGNISVSLYNRGKDRAEGVYLDLEMQDDVLGACLLDGIAPGRTTTLQFVLPTRPFPGNYVVASRASYLNEDTRLGVSYVSTVRYESESVLPLTCKFSQALLRDSTTVTVPKPTGDGVITQFVAPSHVRVSTIYEDSSSATFLLRNTRTEFRTDSSAFVTYETVSQGTHSAAICEGRVNTLPEVQRWTFYSSTFLIAAGLLGLLISIASFAARPRTAIRIAFARWGFSVAVCSLFYLGYRHLGVVADLLGPWLEAWQHSGKLPAVQRSVRTIVFRTYFVGTDFENFFLYGADALYTYMLFGNYFVLRTLIRPQPESEKYWNLMVRCYSSIFLRPLVRLLSKRNAEPVQFEYSRHLSNVALLAYLVKLFYVPLLWSWGISNIFHLQALSGGKNWTFFVISKALIDVMIFVDVTIFCVGYVVEIPRLKNVIKTVEPTLLGWFVCIVCYPPFNSVFFPFFDIAIVKNPPVMSEATRGVVTFLTVILWFIYTWASVALGMKSSNLTNRGIIAHGPYRYVRHPAYAAKVSVWVLGALFLNEAYGLNIFAALCIYTLRAITEERHLLSDPDYVEYRKKVPWMFVPGIL